PLILVHLGALAIFLTGGSLFDWLIFALLLYLRGLCVVLGYHRYFSHRSFQTSRLAQFLLPCCCCATFQPGPLLWALFPRLPPPPCRPLRRPPLPAPGRLLVGLLRLAFRSPPPGLARRWRPAPFPRTGLAGTFLATARSAPGHPVLVPRRLEPPVRRLLPQRC